MSKDIHPEYIKYLIKRKGATLSDIARDKGYSPSIVHQAFKEPVFYGEQIIAMFLNVHPMTLWPSRYDESGNPLHSHASANNLKAFHPKNQDFKKVVNYD